jgi:hypothetical protein
MKQFADRIDSCNYFLVLLLSCCVHENVCFGM